MRHGVSLRTEIDKIDNGRACLLLTCLRSVFELRKQPAKVHGLFRGGCAQCAKRILPEVGIVVVGGDLLQTPHNRFRLRFDPPDRQQASMPRVAILFGIQLRQQDLSDVVVGHAETAQGIRRMSTDARIVASQRLQQLLGAEPLYLQ